MKAIRDFFDRILGSDSSSPGKNPRSVKSSSRRKPAPRKSPPLSLEEAKALPRKNGRRELVKYLSLRQPWAWLVLNGHKDIENRTTNSHFRGELFIHASSNRTGLEDDLEYVRKEYGIEVPVEELRYGCILGSVLMLDCVKKHDSLWFEGPFGYVFAEPRWITPHDLKANANMQKTYDVQITYCGL